MFKSKETLNSVQVKAKPVSAPPAASGAASGAASASGVAATPPLAATVVHLGDVEAALPDKKSGNSPNDKTDLEGFSVETMTALHYQKTLSDLKDFAEKTLNNENLEFINAVQAIEKQLSDDSKVQKKTIEVIQKSRQYQQTFKEIYDRYIPARATKSINISKPARSKLTEENEQYTPDSSMTLPFTLASFMVAYVEIKNLAEAGFIKEFKDKRAKSFRDLQNEREHSHHSRAESHHASTNPGSLLYMHDAAKYQNTTGPLTPRSKDKSHLQGNKQVIITLQGKLKSYLSSISSYQNDNTGCGCLCFGYCKLDKPAIYKNINGLMATLEHAIQHWQEAKVVNLQLAISEAQKRHLALVGKQKQTIITSINTALAALTIENVTVHKVVIAGRAVHPASLK